MTGKCGETGRRGATDRQYRFSRQVVGLNTRPGAESRSKKFQRLSGTRYSGRGDSPSRPASWAWWL